MKDENIVALVAVICCGFVACFFSQCTDVHTTKVQCVAPAQANK